MAKSPVKRARNRKRGEGYCYKRKSTSRQSWTEIDMGRAIAAVRNKECGYELASKTYSVPKTTLVRRVKDRNKVVLGSIKGMGQSSILPAELENRLVDHILRMEEALFGLTYTDVRKLAFELAEQNDITNNFNKTAKMAGYYWLYGFLRRHPEITLREPENTSIARSRSFNKTNVDRFFELYQKLLDNHKFQPHRIFNCDEKGVTTVPNNPPKILARSGKKQVGTVGSGEKGTNTTVMLCACADGNLIPPMFVFPRVKDNPDLLRGAPVGSIQVNNKSGWVVQDSFIQWLNHFIKYSTSSISHPCLLILDGHSTHIKSIEAINIARENGVHILCLPPHCTHRMQPLDITCMKPLSSALAREVQLWHRDNPSNILKINHIAEIFCSAYTGSIGPAVVLNGFAKCGIWPLKPDVFDGCFTSAHQTSTNAQDDDQANTTPDDQATAIADNDPKASADSDDHEISPDTDVVVDKPPAADPDIDVSIKVFPEDIIPVPKVVYKDNQEATRKPGKAKGATVIVTSSPYLKKLTIEEENKKLKEDVKNYNREIKALKKALKLKEAGEAGDSTAKTKVRRELFSGKGKSKKICKKKKKNKVLNIENDEVPKVICSLASTSPSTIDFNNLAPGQFVLVSFNDFGVSDLTEENPSSSKESKPVYYAGFITRVCSQTDVETKFLRRSDLKKGNHIKFTYPDEEDLCTHDIENIVLLLPKPKTAVGKSKRLESILEFEDERLQDYNPIM